jgi:hypoxanthine-guanine phosphoribosyltransferase
MMKEQKLKVSISTDFDQKDLLICDDALYSGNQMHNTLSYYTRFDNKIHVLAPYCSAEAQQLIAKKFPTSKLDYRRNYEEL